MNILMVGDVVGKPGRETLSRFLRRVKRENGVDLCVVNGENSAEGNGIDPASAQEIFDAGADVITTGNHVWQKRTIYDTLDESPYLLRPDNYPDGCPGRGTVLVDCGKSRVLIANLMGVCFLEPLENPFRAMDRILKKYEGQADVVVLDFHAEATSEKIAMGFYLDGRASVVVGTHTHVQTADERIFPSGLGYITDLGMTGPERSVLGLTPECVLQKFRTSMPVRFVTAEGPGIFSAALFTVDEKSGRATAVQRIQIHE